MVQCNGNLIVFACEDALMHAILLEMGSNLAKAERRRSRHYVSPVSAIRIEGTESTQELLGKIVPLYLKDPVAALNPNSRTSAADGEPAPPDLKVIDGYTVLSLAFATDGGVVDSDVTQFVRALPSEQCGIAACHWFDGLERRLLIQGNLRDAGPFRCGGPAGGIDSLELFFGQDMFATPEQWERFLHSNSSAGGDVTSPHDDGPQGVANRRLAAMIGDAGL
ncbi:MAG: hypothetical protein HFJ75_05040 [Eggerthellaceae bacterium]|nr:hypothetical protein [Eggerthellaceae bacterium]